MADSNVAQWAGSEVRLSSAQGFKYIWINKRVQAQTPAGDVSFSSPLRKKITCFPGGVIHKEDFSILQLRRMKSVAFALSAHPLSPNTIRQALSAPGQPPKVSCFFQGSKLSWAWKEGNGQA